MSAIAALLGTALAVSSLSGCSREVERKFGWHREPGLGQKGPRYTPAPIATPSQGFESVPPTDRDLPPLANQTMGKLALRCTVNEKQARAWQPVPPYVADDFADDLKVTEQQIKDGVQVDAHCNTWTEHDDHDLATTNFPGNKTTTCMVVAMGQAGAIYDDNVQLLCAGKA